jgi:hypothetical protein
MTETHQNAVFSSEYHTMHEIQKPTDIKTVLKEKEVEAKERNKNVM